MKVMIEIDETLIDKTIWLDVNNLDTEDLELMRYAIRNGTPLNGTNGDVLKAVFPNMIIVEDTEHDCLSISNDFWNADYKGVE